MAFLLGSVLTGLAAPKFKWKGSDSTTGSTTGGPKWERIDEPDGGTTGGPTPEEPTGTGEEILVFDSVDDQNLPLPGPQTVEVDQDDFAVKDLEFVGSGRPDYTVKKTPDTAGKLTLTGNVKAEGGGNVKFEDLKVELAAGDRIVDVDTETSVSFLGGIDGSGKLKKLGGGALKLGGVDGDFSGGVEVIAGSLLLTSSSTSTNGIKGPAGSGTLILGNDTILAPDAGDTDISLDNAIVLSGGRAKVGQGNAKLTLKGNISGVDGTLEAQGSLDLEGENSYAGLDLKSNKVVAKGNQTVKTLVGELASELEIALGRTFTVDGVTDGPGSVHKGGISGQGTFEIFKGLTILEGTSSDAISTIIGELGELQIGNGTAAGAINGNIHIQNQGKLRFDRPDQDGGYAVPGVITGSGKLINERGFTILDGANGDFTGGIEVRGGVLAAKSHNAFGTGMIKANSNAVIAVMNNASVANPLQLSTGSTIAGIGQFRNAIIGSGVTLAPGLNNGQPVGELKFEELTLGGGGFLDWNLKNRHGAGGTGWDLITVTSSSTLTIAATAADQFTLKLSTIGSGGNTEVIGDFEVGQNYQWLVFDTAGIDGFDPDSFAFDATNFLTGFGITENDFSLSMVGNDLFLNFTPVPEPSTYALILVGLGMSGLTAWRRRRGATR